MAHLTLVLDNREVRKFVLSKGVTTIGRAQDNDIVINNLALSRRHAQVEWKNGGYQVVDLESQNGVFVNNRRVQPASELRNEDTIMLGTYQFVFREDGEDAGRDRPEVYTRQKVKAVATPSRPPPPPEPPAESVDEEEDCPLLVLKYNDMELQRHVVRQDESLVGRAKECDIQIPERRLSRRHCAIVRGEAGRYFVKDLGSQNGTYVNRRRIKGLCEIKDGDVLNFAEYTVSFLSSMAEYSGPDSVHVRSPAARRAGPDDDRARVAKGGFRSSSEVAFKDTMMPRAYRDAPRPDEAPDEDEPGEESVEEAPPPTPPPRARPSAPPPRPSELGEPLTEPPDRARKKRVQLRSEPPAPPTPPSAVPPRKRPRTEPPAPAPVAPRRGPEPAKRRPPPARRDDEADVDDPGVEARPEPEMRDWYAARSASRLYDPLPEVGGAGARDDDEDEEELAMARSQSSISQILDPMTVNKQELEDNLRADANERRFYVEVQHGPKTLYSGPLLKPVTILGTDPDAEIRLKGRFVAGRHSILVRVRDSLLLVRLGSSSAARVNGLPKLQAFLKTGDVIQIDETTIRITEE